MFVVLHDSCLPLSDHKNSVWEGNNTIFSVREGVQQKRKEKKEKKKKEKKRKREKENKKRMGRDGDF